MRTLPFISALFLLGCSSVHRVERVCGSIDVIPKATTAQLFLNGPDRAGAPIDAVLMSALRRELASSIPGIRFVTDPRPDLVIYFNVTDCGWGRKDCPAFRWHWSASVDTWLPLPSSSPPQVTFVALLNADGNTGDSLATTRAFGRVFHRVVSRPSTLPASTYNCVIGGASSNAP